MDSKLHTHFLVMLLVGVGVLTLFIFAPFLKPLGLAAAFAVVLGGLNRRVGKVLTRTPSLSALITIIIGVGLILLPLSFVGVLVANQARSLYGSFEAGGAQNAVAQFFNHIEERFGATIPGLGEFSRNISTNVSLYSKEALQWIAQHAGTIFSSLSSLLLATFLFLVALYYLLRDGARVREALIELSPLNDREDRRVLDRLEAAINSVIKGNLMLALIQGVLTTIGFLIFGVPNAILWGMVAAIAALIPGLGTGLVFVPTILFLYASGATGAALGVLIWGVLAVGLVDNILGPKLVGKGMQLHPLLILVSVLGGLMFFGPSGIIFGPLTLALLFALLAIYVDESRAARS